MVDDFLAARAVPGIEEASPYRRTVRLAHGPAIVALEGDPRAAAARVVAAHPRDRPAAARALARLAGPDPSAADAHLAGDPVLGPLVVARPGLRMPGTVDGGELAVRAVLGQQVSLAAARTLAGRLVEMAGEPLEEPAGALTHLWPVPKAIAEAAPRMPMPRARQRTLAALAEALADGLVLERGGAARAARHRAVDGRTTSRCASAIRTPGCRPTSASAAASRRSGSRRQAADAWRPHRTHAVRHLWAVAPAARGRARPGSRRAPAA